MMELDTFGFKHFVVPMGISSMGNSGRFPQGESAATEAHYPTLSSPVQFSSVHDGMYAFGKAHMRSTPSFRSFPNVALETVPMLF